MTPEQAAEFSRQSVRDLGGAFTECPGTLRRARQLGLTGWAFYVTGRAGALGDVRWETAAAALGFVAAEAVRDGWEAASRVATPAEIAGYHREECGRWGRLRLDGFAGVRRLAELAERVVLAADPAGLPLFAAWRAVPVPADGPGARAAVLAHLLSEQRAGATLVAVRAGGFSPLEFLLGGPDGETAAIAGGWQPPFPPPGPLMRKRIWADGVADRITGQAFAVLAPGERAELVGLLAEASRLTSEMTVELSPVP